MTPAAAEPTTVTGASLPIVSTPQTELLTVNLEDIPLLQDAVDEGISFKPMCLDREGGLWVIMAYLEPGKQLPMHYHTGPAQVYTVQGRWLYREYPDQPQTAGSYLYEPSGSVHTLYTPEDNTEITIFLAIVYGTNVNFDEDGRFHSLLDAVSLAHLVDTAAEAQGLGEVRYIGGGDMGYTAEANGR